MKTYYSIYEEDAHVSGAEPVNLEKQEILEISKKVFLGEDNFIGFIDSMGTLLQFLPTDEDIVWVEVPSPVKKGSYGKEVSLKEALEIISSLDGGFKKKKKKLNLKASPKKIMNDSVGW